MFSCENHRRELDARIESITSLLDATHPIESKSRKESETCTTILVDASKEARGLAILLLYAAYESLIVTLCRTILVTATRLRVGNRRLKPGLKLFAIHSYLQSLSDSNQGSIWNGNGLKLIKTIDNTKECTINTNTFPKDGSHMKKSQICTFCNLLDLGDPGPILREVWDKIDSVVIARNKIAHGELRADEVGREYTVREVRDLVKSWHLRWIDFLNWVEIAGSTRTFYRT